MKELYVWYLYVHSEIYKGFRWKWEVKESKDNTKEMTETDFRNSLSEWRVPKVLTPLIQKEMEMIGLIKKEKRNLIILNKPMFDKEDCNYYYKKLNLF